jgi:hypothetical protein
MRSRKETKMGDLLQEVLTKKSARSKTTAELAAAKAASDFAPWQGESA